MSHCGKHDRLRDLRLTQRRTDVQWLLWVVFGSVDSWWDLLGVWGALLCWARDHHHQVGCQLRLYPGGLWRLFGFHPSMDFSSDHRAHQSGCDSHHLLQLHGAAHLLHVYSTLRGQSSAGCSLHMWVDACGCVSICLGVAFVGYLWRFLDLKSLRTTFELKGVGTVHPESFTCRSKTVWFFIFIIYFIFCFCGTQKETFWRIYATVQKFGLSKKKIKRRMHSINH